VDGFLKGPNQTVAATAMNGGDICLRSRRVRLSAVVIRRHPAADL
jgi:hypothetical protein